MQVTNIRDVPNDQQKKGFPYYVGMKGRPWTNEENELVVEDYFEMLAADLVGQHYKKSEHNRNLQSLIDRTRGAIVKLSHVSPHTRLNRVRIHEGNIPYHGVSRLG